MAATDNDAAFDYIVVGGGCNGASTALALIREWPTARVIWYEGTHTTTASKDINKIIRTAYIDDDYIEFAEEAQKIWRTEDPYRQFYHEPGWLQLIGDNVYRKYIKKQKNQQISVEEMKSLVGCSQGPVLEEGEELWLNDTAGWADAARAVEAVGKLAASLGVVREAKDITRVITEGDLCQGVEVDGSLVRAKTTILATAAWTPRLLEHSNIEFPENFFTVSGVGVAVLSLTDDEFEQFKHMPTLVLKNGEIMFSEIHKVIKITTSHTMRITHPDDITTQISQFDISHNQVVLDKFLPQFKGRKLDFWICPDLMTPYQYPLVDEAPKNPGLFFVVGGSYHGYKFLPNMGAAVVERLRGQSSSKPVIDRLMKKWSWERPGAQIEIHVETVPKESVAA